MGQVVRIEVGRKRHGKLSLPVYKPVPKLRIDVPYRSNKDTVHAAISRELASAAITKAATTEKPTVSWWVGLTREQFAARAAAELERMSLTKIGQQTNLTHGDDIPRVRSGTAKPSEF